MPIDWSKYDKTNTSASIDKKIDWSKFDKKQKEPKEQDELMQHALGMSYGAGSLNKALSSLPSSASNLISGYIQALGSPIESSKSLADIAGGGLGKILPKSLRTDNPARDIRQEEAFNQFIDRFSHRLKNPKETFETDPLGMLADYSTLISPISPRISNAVNPVNLMSKGAGKVIPAIGSGIAEIIGGIGTRTGGESLRKAAIAGMEGGQKSTDFLNNLTTSVPITDVVQTALKGQDALRKSSFQKYLDETAGPFADITPMNLQDIRKAVNRSNAMDITPEGIDLNPATAGVKQNINELVKQFEDKNLNKIRNLDEMKRGIGNIMKNTDPSKTEYRAAKNVYDAIKDEIDLQNPQYKEAMKNSEESLKVLNEIRTELSLNPKANIGTQLRKLQSTTRNNANTSYGQRVSLAQLLEDSGADNLTTQLAGQALNTWSPRGLGTITQGGTLGAGVLTGNLPQAILLTALQSPKLMGLLSYGAGKTAGGIKKSKALLSNAADSMGISPEILSNYLYQSQIGQQQ